MHYYLKIRERGCDSEDHDPFVMKEVQVLFTTDSAKAFYVKYDIFPNILKAIIDKRYPDV